MGPHAASVLDLNADIGEGATGDSALLSLVTSASIACGFHAGDEATMRMLCREAVARGVAIGAHVSYRDREGFGRRPLEVDPATIEAETAEQLSALERCAVAEGGRIAYVKPHGALYARAAVDADCAAAIVSAMLAYGPPRVVLAPPGSALLAEAQAAGLPIAAEGFADRAYSPTGGLVTRDEPGAVLGEAAAVAQALEIAIDRAVTAADGHRIDLPVRSLCVHGDSPGTPALAQRIVDELHAAGVDLRAFA